MSIAFLFAGQGVQKIGMGQSVYEAYPASRAVFDQANFDIDVKQLCFYGPQEMLDDTRYTQVSLLVTSLAIAKAAESEGIIPDVVAGLSLGEYSALTYAKAFSVEDAISLVIKRGAIMSSALEGGKTGMVAVLGSTKAVIEEVLALDEVKQAGICEIANYNSPNQIVITGENVALDMAVEQLKLRGAKRLIPLQVSGAFHSQLLKDASILLQKELLKVNVSKPELDVIMNVSGQKEEDIVDALRRQICSSVQFIQTIETMVDMGVDTFVEVGPGQVLSSFVRKIAPKAKVLAMEDVASIQKCKEAIYGN